MLKTNFESADGLGISDDPKTFFKGPSMSLLNNLKHQIDRYYALIKTGQF